MSITNILNLKKNSEGPITTKTRKKIQSDFLESLNWNFEDFLQFLKIVGIENPTTLEVKEGKIVVKDKENGEIDLSFDEEMEISLQKRDNVGRMIIEDYEVSKKIPLDKNKIILKKRVISKGEKKLIHSRIKICPLSCTVGWFDEKYLVNVFIDDRSYTGHQKSKISQNTTIQKIYDYLLDPELKVNVEKIFKDLIEMIGLSKQDILSSKDIMISLDEIGENKDIARDKIHISQGRIYGISKTNKDGETLSVSRSGNWHYTSAEGNTISFEGSKKNYKEYISSNLYNKLENAFLNMEKFEQNL